MNFQERMDKVNSNINMKYINLGGSLAINRFDAHKYCEAMRKEFEQELFTLHSKIENAKTFLN